MLLARGRRDSIAIPVCCDALSPEMAQSEHPTVARQCPLLGVKRTSTVADLMSAFDPKRTSAAQHYRQRNDRLDPFRRSQIPAVINDWKSAQSQALGKR